MNKPGGTGETARRKTAGRKPKKAAEKKGRGGRRRKGGKIVVWGGEINCLCGIACGFTL